MSVRIDELPEGLAALLDHQFPVIREGQTVRLTLQQVVQMMLDNAAFAVPDLSNTTGARGPIAAAFSGNVDNLVTNGKWLTTTAATNVPVSGQRFYIEATGADDTGANVTQVAKRMAYLAATDSYTYRREKSNGTWTPWYRVRQLEGELDGIYIREDEATPIGKGLLTAATEAEGRALLNLDNMYINESQASTFGKSLIGAATDANVRALINSGRRVGTVSYFSFTDSAATSTNTQFGSYAAANSETIPATYSGSLLCVFYSARMTVTIGSNASDDFGGYVRMHYHNGTEYLDIGHSGGGVLTNVSGASRSMTESFSSAFYLSTSQRYTSTSWLLRPKMHAAYSGNTVAADNQYVLAIELGPIE